MLFYTKAELPIGTLTISASDAFISRLFLTTGQFEEHLMQYPMTQSDYHPLLIDAKIQLAEYFEGKRTQFELPLKQSGTAFQERVWTALAEIPFGESWTYSDVAKKIGNPKAVRAIGQANKSNSLPIFIPCHRVIGTGGKLTGYAGTKTNLKAFLLDLEKISYRT
jgi:methylated-DNA-[protein]-cysteine S-methyltransferase